MSTYTVTIADTSYEVSIVEASYTVSIGDFSITQADFEDLKDVTITSGAEGDVFYRDSNGDIVNLGPGTSGQVLQTQGADNPPRWATVSGVGGGASELSDLSDVNTSTPTNRNVLVADGTDWESRALVEADISDLGSYADASHTHTASDITDFDTAVGNNTAVAANTAARHDAVTVSDSSEIDLTLTGQEISAAIVAGSIDESKLDTSVNASLDLADSALQNLIEDTNATLGSDLNLGGFDIVGTVNDRIILETNLPTATAVPLISLKYDSGLGGTNYAKAIIGWVDDNDVETIWIQTHDYLSEGNQHKHFSIEASDAANLKQTRFSVGYGADVVDVNVNAANFYVTAQGGIRALDIDFDDNVKITPVTEFAVYPQAQATYALRVDLDNTDKIALTALGGSDVHVRDHLHINRGTGTDNYLRVEGENVNTFQGGYFHYDNVANEIIIGSHNTADELTASDVPVITIPRAGGLVSITGGLDADGAVDFGAATSLEVPNGATPTVNADGEIAVDTTVTDFSHGILKYYSGEEMAVVALPIAELTTPTGGHVIAYNATNDEFELVALAGGGDMSASTYDPATIAEQVVGLTATQTLTNKTIDADNNTISNIALGAEATGALGDLSNVTQTALGADELLFTQDGSTWINQTLAEAGISAVGHTHTASDITDFDTEVANNSAVTANTAKVTNATHTGDVTGSGALTIANDAVTYAKMQNVAANNVLLGNNSGAGGIVDELTAAEVRTILNVEDGADVTDTTNVTAAGALMDSEVTNLAAVKAFDPTDYAASSHNHATTDITSGTFADARIAASNVTQHEAALTITESQISDLGSYTTASSTDTLTNKTINGDNNTISNLDIGNEVDWAAAADVSDAGTPASGDKLLLFEAGVGLRKIDWDDLPSGGGGVSDGDKGDITVSGSGSTWTIDNDAVSYAKIQNVAADNVLLGNNSGAGGVVDELTASEVRTILNVEDGADVTDTANVTSAGALMDSEVTNLSGIKTLTVPDNTTISTFGASLVDDTTAAAARTTLGLVIGTDVQAYDAELAAIAGLTSAADRGIYFTGSGTASLFTLTSAARSILDDASTAAIRTTLGVGTGDSPQFAAVNIGNASDTTVTRTAAGSIAVEGNLIYRAGGTDVPVTDGGTGASTAAAARTNLGVAVRSFTIAQFASGDAWSVGDGTIAWAVPASLNGANVTGAGVGVYTAGTTGTMDIQIRRRRAGSSADVLSTKITLGSGDHAANDGVVNGSNDDLQTGDLLLVDVDAVHTTPAEGGSVWVEVTL